MLRLAAFSFLAAVHSECQSGQCPVQDELHKPRADVMLQTKGTAKQQATVTESDVVLEPAPSDTEGCDKHVLQFSNRDVLHNNLGGAGPDKGEEALIFGNVLPAIPGLQLKITALSAYEPTNSNENGANGAYGIINLGGEGKDGKAVDLQFAFVNDAGESVEVGPFVVTFLDFDLAKKKKHSKEVMKLSGFTKFTLHDETHVKVKNQKAGEATFAATRRGNAKDNPFHVELTEEQKQRAVTVYYPKSSSFKVSFKAKAKVGGRSFLFSGATTMVCPPLPPTCVENVMIFKEGGVSHNNLGGAGPDKADPKALVLDGVFPDINKHIQMKVTALSPYKPAKSSVNGILGIYGQINLGEEEDVKFKFEFVDSTNQQPIEIGPFVLSFLDLDLPKSGGTETLTITGHTAIKVSEESELKVEEDGEAVKISATKWGTGKDNPTSDVLTKKQAARTVAITYPKTSSFTIGFKTKSDVGGRNFQFTGPTTLTCWNVR